MKLLSRIACFLFLPATGFSQNLVINPSFETFTTCPNGPGSFGVQTWIQPYPIPGGCSTSDYYNACNTNGFADVPGNFLGTENALSGVGYAGIMLYEIMTPTPCGPPKGNDYREYVEGMLSTPLTAGQTYSVSFHLSLPENVMFACDDIGIYFSNTAVNLPCPAPLAPTVLAFTPQLQYTGPAVNNVNGWTKLQWIYTASGGEQYLTIGNFKNDANSNGICSNPSTAYMFAYYYIDDVEVSITPPSSTLNTTASAINALCNGQCTGAATANPASGTPPYSFLWSNTQTTASITGLCAGNYSVVVTDASSATASAVVTVNQPTAITANTSVTPSSCGGSTGTAAVAAAGGSPPYAYLWNPSAAATATATGLSAGNYSVLVTDANGCTQTATATIVNSNGPAVTATSSNASCNGVNNGSATASASGGTAPYTYSWNNGQTTSVATALASGSYTVIVTDANGCSIISTTTVLNSGGPTATANGNITIQAGTSATLNASGGTTYAWTPAYALDDSTLASPTASPSATTTYCVYVYDASGCYDSACVTVSVIQEPIVCGEFYLPNAFSPNDDGENEVFMAFINPLCVVEFKLTIYNRWGEKVFETEDVTQSWNGYLNGAVSNSAVYSYFCTAELTNGKSIEKKGNISLLR